MIDPGHVEIVTSTAPTSSVWWGQVRSTGCPWCWGTSPRGSTRSTSRLTFPRWTRRARVHPPRTMSSWISTCAAAVTPGRLHLRLLLLRAGCPTWTASCWAGRSTGIRPTRWCPAESIGVLFRRQLSQRLLPPEAGRPAARSIRRAHAPAAHRAPGGGRRGLPGSPVPPGPGLLEGLAEPASAAGRVEQQPAAGVGPGELHRQHPAGPTLLTLVPFEVAASCDSTFPPPPGLLPYVDAVTVGEGAICQPDSMRICPGDSILVSIRGSVPNNCVGFRRVELLPPPNPTLRVVPPGGTTGVRADLLRLRPAVATSNPCRGPRRYGCRHCRAAPTSWGWRWWREVASIRRPAAGLDRSGVPGAGQLPAAALGILPRRPFRPPGRLEPHCLRRHRGPGPAGAGAFLH